MRRAEYEAIDAVNWSTLRYMRVSPKEYRYRKEHGTSDTAAMRLGRALHALLPTREEYEGEWIVYTDGAARRGKAWEAFREKHRDREILTPSEAEAAECMAASVTSDPVAQRYIGHGERERVLTWTDEVTGVACKGITDLVNGRVVEFKSTAKIEPPRFFAHAAGLGYHGQLSFYCDGVDAAGYGITAPPVMIAVQSAPPWDVVVYDEIPDAFLEAGRRLYRGLLDKLVECRFTNEWPGVAGGRGARMELAAFAEIDDEEEGELTIGGVPVEV